VNGARVICVNADIYTRIRPVRNLYDRSFLMPADVRRSLMMLSPWSDIRRP